MIEVPIPPTYKPEDFKDDAELQQLCTRQWQAYNSRAEESKRKQATQANVKRALAAGDFGIAYSILMGCGTGITLEELKETTVELD